VNAVERCLADAEDEGATLLEADVGGTLDEIGGDAVGDTCESSHGAGENDHAVGGVAAGGDVGPDVRVGVLLDLGAGFAEEFGDESVAAAELHLFGEDAEGGFGGDEVDFGDAGVGGEGAQDFRSVDGAAGSGDS